MERPILFSAPMVRAILEGRKTQTRRVVNPPKNGSVIGWGGPGIAMASLGVIDDCEHITTILSQYGQPGDRLWVRETWQGPLVDEELEEEFSQSPDYFKKPDFCVYRATDTLDAINVDGDEIGWRPSIHMPRWASRIQLEITGVRVERLHDISQEDCIAEGCIGGHGAISGYAYSATPFEHYRAVWESINGAGSWNANPWVWVIDFKREEDRHAS